MTKEEAKIKRLEKKIADLKDIVKDLEDSERKKERELMIERQWRKDFQRLMKDVVNEDNLDEYY